MCTQNMQTTKDSLRVLETMSTSIRSLVEGLQAWKEELCYGDTRGAKTSNPDGRNDPRSRDGNGSFDRVEAVDGYTS